VGRPLVDDLRRAFSAQPRERSVLVVVDDVPEPLPGEPPLPIETWCPMRGLSPVLLTSRLHRIGETGSVESITIDVLSVSAAVQLLTEQVPTRASLSDSEWKELAAWVGYLPLALILLHAAFLSGTLVPTTMLDRARSGASTTRELDAAMDALRYSVPAGQLRGISEAFLASYECLSSESRLAAQILAQGASTLLPEAVIDALGNVLISPEVRTMLVAHSVITPTRGTSSIFGVMHGVLADFLRGQADSRGEGKEDALRMARALIRLYESLPADRPTNWSTLGAAAPHAEMVAQRLGPQNNDALLLRVLLGEWQGEVGKYAIARDLFADILTAAESTLGPDDPLTLRCRYNLARQTGKAGNPTGALLMFEALVPDMTRAMGSEARTTFRSRAGLGFWSGEYGQFSRATNIFAPLLTEMEAVLGSEDGDVEAVRANLASWSAQASGDITPALQLYTSLLVERTQRLGPNHPRTFTAHNELAYWTGKSGDFTGAVRILEDLLPRMEEVLPADHPLTERTRSLLEGARSRL